VPFAKIDLKSGAPVRKLTIQHGEVFAGDVSGQFIDAEPFKFLPGVAPTN
jgi:choloylglycine hydrolase